MHSQNPLWPGFWPLIATWMVVIYLAFHYLPLDAENVNVPTVPTVEKVNSVPQKTLPLTSLEPPHTYIGLRIQCGKLFAKPAGDIYSTRIFGAHANSFTFITL